MEALSLVETEKLPVIRRAYIGFKDFKTPESCMRIDVGIVYSGRPLYPEIQTYCTVTRNPTLFVPDSRILSGDAVKQIIHCLRRYENLSLIVCADRVQDIPRIFRYFITPEYSGIVDTYKSLPEVVVEKVPETTPVVECLAELHDLGFITPETQRAYLLALIMN
jgi:hypothetical protein